MDKLKILFVDTSIQSFAREDTLLLSLGFVSLGSHVKADVPCEVKLIRLQNIKSHNDADMQENISKLIDLVSDEKPDIVGFSATHVNQILTLEVAKRVKVRTNALIVFGGCNPTDIDDPLLNSFDFVDLIFRGETERTFIQFCKELSDMKKSGKKIEKDIVISSCTLAGVSYLDQDGQLKRNKHPGMIADIDSLKYLDPELLLVYPRISLSKSMLMEYSRGCPFGCAFCSSSPFWAKTFRRKSPDRLIAEIKYYRDTLGIDSLEFVDDNFFTDPKIGLKNISKIRELGFIKKIEICTRINSLNKEIMDELKKFEEVRLFFGMESASPSVLHDMKKGISIEQINDKLHLLEGCDNFNFIFSFIIGYPTETDNDLDKTFEFIMQLKKNFPKNGTAVLSHIDYEMNTPITNRYSSRLVRAVNPVFEDYIGPGLREQAKNKVFFIETLCPDFRLDRQDKELFYRLMFTDLTNIKDGNDLFAAVLSTLKKTPVGFLREMYEYVKLHYDIDFVKENYSLMRSDSDINNRTIRHILFFLFLRFLNATYPEIGMNVPDLLKLVLKRLTSEQFFFLFNTIYKKNTEDFLGFPIKSLEQISDDGLKIIYDEMPVHEMQQRIAALETLSKEEKGRILLAFFTVKYPGNVIHLFYFGPELSEQGYIENPLKIINPDEQGFEVPACKTLEDIKISLDQQIIFDL